MRKHCLYIGIISILTALVALSGCKDEYDRVSTSASDQPEFSADTVKLDTLFSRISSSTRTLMVYNRHKQAIKLSQVRLQGGSNRGYRINVDGRSGNRFDDLTILPEDSLYVFVEATFPRGADDLPTLVEDSVAIVCSGRTSYVLLHGFRQNVDEVDVLDICAEHTIDAQRPLVVRDSIVVQAGGVLRLQAGARLLMGSESKISVYGRIEAQGTPKKRIRIESLRQDYLLSDLPYPLVPGQWQGMTFGPQSKNNTFDYTTLRNATNGMLFAPTTGTSELRASLNGCILTNIKGVGIRAAGGRFELTNTELSNSLGTTLDLRACSATLTYCSIINFYPWEARQGVALSYRDFVTPPGGDDTKGSDAVPGSRLFATNCVIDGNRSLKRTKPEDRVGEIHLFYASNGRNKQDVSLDHCFLRALSSLQATMSVCTFALPDASIELKEKRYYQSLGYAAKAPYKVSFVFDFRPLANAPFVGKALPIGTVSTDLWGIARAQQPTPGAQQPTPGAYEPISAPAKD